MIKAYPINRQGERTGEVKEFSSEQWDNMKSRVGKGFFPFKVAKDEVKKATEIINKISTKGRKAEE